MKGSEKLHRCSDTNLLKTLKGEKEEKEKEEKEEEEDEEEENEGKKIIKRIYIYLEIREAEQMGKKSLEEL